MTKHNEPVIGIDIGSAKTSACIGNIDETGRIEIFNAAMVKTRGIERGMITDLGEVSGCISEVVKKIESKYSTQESLPGAAARRKNFKVNSVFVTISGDHILGNNTKGLLSLSNRPVEISRLDTKKAIDSAKYLSSSLDREVLHALSQEFIVDGYRRIKDPLGIYGMRLGVNLHVISGATSFINSIVKAINRAGLDVNSLVYSGLATSMSVLTEKEKQQGVVLLEIGAGTTNVLFFKDGSLQFTSVIPLGGNDVTAYVAETLGVDLAQAEQLKMQYKSAVSSYHPVLDPCEDKIIIKKDGVTYQSITRAELSAIIDKKIEEIFKFIKKEIEITGIVNEIKSGVLCGGMSFMDGIIEKMENTIKIPVHLGIVRGFVSNFPGANNAFYSTAIGAVIYALQEFKVENRNRAVVKGMLGQVLARARNLYEEYF